MEWEWRDRVQTLGEELIRYLVILRDAQGKDDDVAFLTHTGMVWDALDRFGEPSKSEMAAVLKRWDGQRGLVKDAWEEFRELLEEDQDGEMSESSAIGDDDDDLDWMIRDGSLSEEELSRTQAVILSFETQFRDSSEADAKPGETARGFTSNPTCFRPAIRL